MKGTQVITELGQDFILKSSVNKFHEFMINLTESGNVSVHFWVDCLQSSHTIQTPEFPYGSCPPDYH